MILVGDYKLDEKSKSLINDILNSDRITEGRYVAQFEKKFAEIIGTKYCTLVNSGTSALIAGLTSLLYDDRYPKVKKSAKVITTPITYIATSNAIKLVGLDPVYVDVNLETFDINVDAIEALLENSNPDEYCGILPVHLMGYPCDMDMINAIADKYDLFVFEDTAQAHGSKYKGKNTGTFSLLADYSFYIAHNIQVGEMGAVVTNDEKINKLIKQIKANGRVCDCMVCTRSKGVCQKNDLEFDPRFTHEFIGYNFKTMDFQAGLGLVQLEKFDEIIKARQNNVKYLNDKLKKYEEYFILPTYDESVSYLAYPIIIREDKLDMDFIRDNLLKLNVESRPLFGCIPTRQPAYKEYKEQYKGKLPNAEYLSDNGFYIACHQYLSQDDLDCIVNAFKEIFNNVRM
jgi:dTDP-4-amino-4,6-dideoxygalactose transaminase